MATDSGALEDRQRTLMGGRQERWLADGLRASRAIWNVIAQQVFFARPDPDPGPDSQLATDAWDGYPAARDRISAAMATPGVSNPIVLSVDLHSNWANHLLAEYDDPSSSTTASESAWRSDYRVVPYVGRRDAPVSTRASLIVQEGQPGLAGQTANGHLMRTIAAGRSRHVALCAPADRSS